MFLFFMQNLATIAVLIYVSRKSSEFSSIHYFISQGNPRDSIIIPVSANEYCAVSVNRVPKEQKKLRDCGRNVCTGKSWIRLYLHKMHKTTHLWRVCTLWTCGAQSAQHLAKAVQKSCTDREKCAFCVTKRKRLGFEHESVFTVVFFDVSLLS